MHSFTTLLRAHARRYPLMQPCDAVKLAYQHVFGGGHLVTDADACLHSLRTECAALGERGGTLLEDIGNGRFRLNLAAVDENELPLPFVSRLFLLSSAAPTGKTQEFLALLEELSLAVRLGLFSFSEAELSDYLCAYQCAGCPPASHSAVYRAAYRPAYRVVDATYAKLLPIAQRLNPLLARGENASVALDGRAAAGKTTAAARLGELYSANVLHMDDFFLPPELRTPERYAQPGGNIHYERFAQEVLPALRGGGPFCHRVFDCSLGAYHGERRLEQRALTVVEGVYSHHPAFEGAYSLRVFLDIPDAEQRRRILARNGPEGLRSFEERWVPLENSYFSRCAIRKGSDLLLTL